MAKDTLYNINIESPAQITREQYTGVGSGDAICGDCKRAFLGGTDFEIWSASTGGTQLVEDTDYELIDQDADLTSRAGADVYTGFKILNATYRTGSIYITYKVIGSYADAGFVDAGRKRDLLINGNMRWWQRGTSFTSVTNGTFSADRWKNLIAAGSGTAPVFNIAIDNTDGINYLMKLTVTTSGVAGTGMYAGVYQKYEFYTMMKGKTVSARIRVNVPSGKTGKLYIYDGVGGSAQLITGTGSFQEVILSHTVSASATVLQVSYYIATGTSFNATSGDIHYIDRIQLTEGATALPFLPYDPILDYKKCLRYYEKSYNYATAPGTASAGGYTTNWYLEFGTTLLLFEQPFSVTKRTTPTMTWYAFDGTANRISLYGGSNYTVSSTSQTSEKKTGCPVLSTKPSSGDLLYGHWVADAEL